MRPENYDVVTRDPSRRAAEDRLLAVFGPWSASAEEEELLGQLRELEEGGGRWSMSRPG
jgi:hypothetical protein